MSEMNWYVVATGVRSRRYSMRDIMVGLRMSKVIVKSIKGESVEQD